MFEKFIHKETGTEIIKLGECFFEENGNSTKMVIVQKLFDCQSKFVVKLSDFDKEFKICIK